MSMNHLSMILKTSINDYSRLDKNVLLPQDTTVRRRKIEVNSIIIVTWMKMSDLTLLLQDNEYYYWNRMQIFFRLKIYPLIDTL